MEQLLKAAIEALFMEVLRIQVDKVWLCLVPLVLEAGLNASRNPF